MASKSGSKPRSPRSFARRGIISSLQNYVIAKVLLKAMWGETERLMLLSCSVFFVGGRVVRQGRWKGSEVGRQGGRVVSWECGKGGRLMRWEGNEVARWERWENGEAERSEVPGFIQGWGTRDESKISSFCF